MREIPRLPPFRFLLGHVAETRQSFVSVKSVCRYVTRKPCLTSGEQIWDCSIYVGDYLLDICSKKLSAVHQNASLDHGHVHVATLDRMHKVMMKVAIHATN